MSTQKTTAGRPHKMLIDCKILLLIIKANMAYISIRKTIYRPLYLQKAPPTADDLRLMMFPGRQKDQPSLNITEEDGLNSILSL